MNFSELMAEVNRVQDTILNDMVYKDTSEEDMLSFRKHLYCSKFWFNRVAYVNKLRFLTLLLGDVTSVWVLTLLLKSIWNCRVNDSVLSSNSTIPWSSYDQVPLDHNRAAIPSAFLADVMTADRAWFLTLDPERQLEVLLELLLVSGGPLMMSTLQRAQQIYDASRQDQLQAISECVAVSPEESPRSRKKKGEKATVAGKSQKEKENTEKEPQSPEETQLEVSLANWDAAIKSLRSSIKMEEVEIICGDEKKKLWKVQRPKSETLETIDQLQLISDKIFKRILRYVPRSQLPELRKVNKYWAAVIEDLKAEEAARDKINEELEKLREQKLVQEPSSFNQLGHASAVWGSTSLLIMTPSQCGDLLRDRDYLRDRAVAAGRAAESTRRKRRQPQKFVASHKPSNKLKDISELLDIRGAMDENIFYWCESIIRLAEEVKHVRSVKSCRDDDNIETFLDLFPSPLIKKQRNVIIPHMSCYAQSNVIKRASSVVSTQMQSAPPCTERQRGGMWSGNLAHLYPAYKIVAHESPV